MSTTAAAPGAGIVHTRATGRRTVVCAVDDDELARDVIATARAEAARMGLPLTLVHSAHPDVFVDPEGYAEAVERGHRLLDRIAGRERGETRVVQLGDAAALISSVAEEDAALIVIGTRERGPLRSALLGSVSRAVRRGARCPVIAVPAAHGSVDGAAA